MLLPSPLDEAFPPSEHQKWRTRVPVPLFPAVWLSMTCGTRSHTFITEKDLRSVQPVVTHGKIGPANFELGRKTCADQLDHCPIDIDRPGWVRAPFEP